MTQLARSTSVPSVSDHLTGALHYGGAWKRLEAHPTEGSTACPFGHVALVWGPPGKRMHPVDELTRTWF
jgi:hypothetical protein